MTAAWLGARAAAYLTGWATGTVIAAIARRISP